MGQFGAHIDQLRIKIQSVLEALEAGILHHRRRLQHPKEKRDKPLSRFQVGVLPIAAVVGRYVQGKSSHSGVCTVIGIIAIKGLERIKPVLGGKEVRRFEGLPEQLLLRFALVPARPYSEQLRLTVNLVRDHPAVDGPAHYAERLSEGRGAAKLESNPKLLVTVSEQENYQSARPFNRLHVFKVACPNSVEPLETIPQLGNLRDEVPEILPLRHEVLAVGFAETCVFKREQ